MSAPRIKFSGSSGADVIMSVFIMLKKLNVIEAWSVAADPRTGEIQVTTWIK
jgi:hypothetical protein